MIIKILFCGDIKGQFGKLIEKLDVLNEKHGPFEAVVSAGVLFADDDDNSEFEKLKSGELKLPIPLIVLGPQQANHCRLYGDLKMLNSGGEICHNLIYPGKSGIYRFINGGLTLAYVSPTINEDGTCTVNNKEFSNLKKLVEKSIGFKGVDFFVTPCWPQSVTTYSQVPQGYNEIQLTSSIQVSHLAKLLKPRYHLAHSNLQPYGCHYERAPYRNHPTNATLQEHVTRFVSLASVYNPDNKKWLYAIRITPLTLMPLSELVEQPPNTTESPYVALPSLLKTGSTQYIKNNSDLHSGGPIRSNRRPKPSASGVSNEPCWFCLNNPKLAKHLIIYVGNHNYVVLAKGGIVPHHLLIVPIEHFPSTLELSKEALDEIKYLKSLLVSLFKLEGSSVIFYERNYASRHLQIQVVPVPRGNPDSLVNTFMNYGKNHNVIFENISHLACNNMDEIVSPNDNYFYVEFEDNRKLLHKIEGKFPLYFGREILASKEVLSLPPYRVDWRKCTLSEQDEKTVVDEIKVKLNACRKNVK